MMCDLLSVIEKSERFQSGLLYSFPEKPFDAVDDLYKILALAIDSKKPFSLVRLGDGEGRILGYPHVFDKKVYVNQVLTYQYGAKVLDKLYEIHGDSYVDCAMLDLKNKILKAVRDADVIGIPSWLHFREKTNDANLIAQAAQAVCVNEVSILKNDHQKVFDHFIFKPFSERGLFHKLFKDYEEIVVVSHTDISNSLIKDLLVRSCQHIKIPGHQSFMKSEELHYPFEFQRIAEEIKKRAEGKVVLVAAGYLGKYYCDVAKSVGGIAIDIGSIFDGWCGVGRPDATKNENHRLHGV